MPQYFGSTTPLTGSATFTSPWVVASPEFDLITGTVFADQSGTLNIDQSGDGSHNDFSTSVAVTGGTGTSFSVTIVANYVRLRYVNGATAQTVFRLYPRWRFNTTI